MAKNLPVIPGLGFQQWRAALSPSLRRLTAPIIPWNFTGTTKQGGNYLTWSAVNGADGYEVQVAATGDFATNPVIHQLPGNNNISYFDSVPTQQGQTPPQRWYRVRATSGTLTLPQQAKGNWSGAIALTAIAPSNVGTPSASTSDTTTTDQSNSKGGRGDYRSVTLNQ